MSVMTDFRKWLLTKADVTNTVKDRICQLHVQTPKELPYVVFRRSAGRAEGLTMDGDAGADVTTLDVLVVGGKSHDLDAVADAIRSAVDGFPQTMTTLADRQWNGRTIQYATVNDVNDEFDFDPPMSDAVDRTIALSIEVCSDG